MTCQKHSFSLKRKLKVDKIKAQDFLKAYAESDSDHDDSITDWMDPVPLKKSIKALEDSSAKRKRLKKEGVIHAEDGRFWEAIHKWESALNFSPHNGVHRTNLVNGGDEEKGKERKLREKIEFKNAFDFSADRLLDAELFEMKAQALMELAEVFPAVEAAEAAVLSNPYWHIGWQTLGRAQLGFGDIPVAIKTFSKAIHLKPDDEEMWNRDLRWALELAEKRKLMNAAQCDHNDRSLAAIREERQSNDEDGRGSFSSSCDKHERRNDLDIGRSSLSLNNVDYQTESEKSCAPIE